MEAPYKQSRSLATPEVMEAIIDLARLSHQIGIAEPGANDAITEPLLKRILTLCEAQEGALLLTIQSPVRIRQVTASSLSNNIARTFVLLGLSEAAAHARLEQYSMDGPDIQLQQTEDNRSYLVCKLPISSMSTVDGENNSRPSSHTATALHQTVLPLFVQLVLGWTGKGSHAAAEKASAILPMLVDVAGSVLANVLLTEQVHTLEVTVNRQAIRDMELLKAELLATVSHELRSPLSSIKGYAATLLRHEQRISREERHDFLLAINEGSDRLAVVIDRLLEMSQLETGTIAVERSPVNLVHLVREAMISSGERVGVEGFLDSELDGDTKEQMPKHNEHHITFTLRLEDQQGMLTNDEPLILADRHRLREVLDNLLENAINYSPSGGMVEVGIRPVEVTNVPGKGRSKSHESNSKKSANVLSLPVTRKMMEITVRDNGIGIPREHLDRIFDHFHRVDTRLTREVNGLGLGLAICKRIIEMHEGEIWAESEVGEGSTFHVLLPMDT